MDITLLATTAAGLIGDWLIRAGGRILGRSAEKVETEVADAVDAKLDALFDAVRGRVGEDANAAFIEDEPESKTARKLLADLIEAEAARDEAFAARLETLVADAREALEQSPRSNIEIGGDVTQVGSGRSNQIIGAQGPITINHGKD